MIELPAAMWGTAALHIEGLHPLLVGDFFEGFVGHLERGVIHQHVDATEFFHRFVNDGQALGLLGQIARQQQALTARLLHPACSLLGVFMLIKVRNRHVGPFAGVGNRYRATNAAVAAGDQRDLVAHAARALVTGFAAVRSRLHLALIARHGLLLRLERRFRVISHRTLL
jgi:hypothetical protein